MTSSPNWPRSIPLQHLSAKQAPSLIVVNDGHLFAVACLLLVAAAAILAASAPVWFSVASVVVFGTPHNFFEFRYFLSRLPSRFVPLKPFFITSFIGLAILTATEIALAVCIDKHIVDTAGARLLLSVWNESLIAWIFALSLLRYRDITRGGVIFNAILAVVTSIANFLSPQMFTVSLIYLHPLVGLWILERELRRTRKAWLRGYHWCLLAIPLSVAVLAMGLQGTVSDTESNRLLTLSTPGAQFFTGASPIMLLAVYTFLQMVHYGVWVLAIPIATQSWRRWRVDQMAFLRERKRLRPVVSVAIGCGVLTVLGFWFGFKLDYHTAIEIYVIMSLAHVLAEVPFMFWMHES